LHLNIDRPEYRSHPIKSRHPGSRLFILSPSKDALPNLSTLPRPSLIFHFLFSIFHFQFRQLHGIR
jgi:hypothetical protein